MSHDDPERSAADFDDSPGAAPDGDGAPEGPEGPEGDDAGWQPDPDAPPDVEGRVTQAMGEMRKLLRASLGATLAMGALVGAWDLARGAQGFPTTMGFLVGAGVATLNLWILAGGFFAIMRGQGTSLRALLAFGGSFLSLVFLAFFVVMARREWTLGFALGLTTPAVAGVLYGRTLKE